MSTSAKIHPDIDERSRLTWGQRMLVMRAYATSPTFVLFAVVLWLPVVFVGWVLGLVDGLSGVDAVIAIVSVPLGVWLVAMLSNLLFVSLPATWWVLTNATGTSLLQVNTTDDVGTTEDGGTTKKEAEFAHFASVPQGEGLGTTLGVPLVDHYVALGYTVTATARPKLAARYVKKTPMTDRGPAWAGFMRKIST